MKENHRYYTSDAGYRIDMTNKQKELEKQAIERCYDEQGGKSEEAYMDLLYPDEHYEYLVNGAMLKCDKTIPDIKVLRGKVYNVKSPMEETRLNVTENTKATDCQRPHATIFDCEIKKNIPPFHCNCSIPPYNDEEWEKLESDSQYMEKGTCGALMKLNWKWDNLPAKTSYMSFSDNKFGERTGIMMTSMLFCKHGGIITPVTSGQDIMTVRFTTTGATLIMDDKINPQGIPLYSRKTMDGKCTYFSLENYDAAKYANVAISRDKARMEGGWYKYIHPMAKQVENLPESFNENYHGSFSSNGNEFSLADNRIEIACRWGISTCDGEAYNYTLAGKYLDIVLSDGTVLACIMGASKGNEPGSDAQGVVHADDSIIEVLALTELDLNVDKYDMLHGCDMVGVYVYSEKRLYDGNTGEYTYYFSESIDD